MCFALRPVLSSTSNPKIGSTGSKRMRGLPTPRSLNGIRLSNHTTSTHAASDAELPLQPRSRGEHQVLRSIGLAQALRRACSHLPCTTSFLCDAQRCGKPQTAAALSIRRLRARCSGPSACVVRRRAEMERCAGIGHARHGRGLGSAVPKQHQSLHLIRVSRTC